MFQQILIPVDLSHPETARRIIGVGKALAEATQARMTLLNVLADPPRYITAELPSGVMEQVRDSAEKDLLALATECNVVNSSILLVRRGQPHNEILAVAEEDLTDLIIVGSHQPGLQDYLLGSVAGRVVRHAKCSVLVDRHPKERGTEHGV